MKVLAVPPGPEFSTADVFRGWIRGLRSLGVDVRTLPYGEYLTFYNRALVDHPTEGLRNALTREQAIALASDRIKVACYDWQPDVVLVVTGNAVTTAVYPAIRRRRTAVVLVATESPYEDDSQVEVASRVDVVLVNDPTNLERFRAVNRRTYYAPHSYDPDLHRPAAPDPDDVSDFCFVGTGFPNRVEFFDAVDWTGIDAAFAGWWGATETTSPLRDLLVHPVEVCVGNDDAVGLYRGTKVSANLYRRSAERPQLEQGWSMGPREVELAATGTFFLREPRGEGDAVLSMLPTFVGPEDFEHQLRWWLAHDQERDERAAQARAAVAGRTFAANATALLRLLEAA